MGMETKVTTIKVRTYSVISLCFTNLVLGLLGDMIGVPPNAELTLEVEITDIARFDIGITGGDKVKRAEVRLF